MAGKSFETRKWEAAEARWARGKRKEAQDAIDADYEKSHKDASDRHRENLSDLNVQLQATRGNPQARRQVLAQINEEKTRFSQEEKQLKDAKSKAMRQTWNLDQYKGGFTNADYDSMASSDEQRFAKVLDSVQGAVDKGYGKKTEPAKKEEKPDNPNIPNLVSGSPSAIENDPFRLKGTDKPLGGGNLFMGNVPLTDEQKKEQADNEKAEKEQKAKEAQERTGGNGLDTKSVNYGEDETGTPTFADYHPAYAAAKAMNKPNKPNEEKDDGEKDYSDYRTAFGLGRYLANRFRADDKDPMNRSAHLRRQAEMHDIEAGDHQRSMQQNLQVANRDYRSEAEKNAASQAAAENAQKVHNLGNAGAGAAALERDVKAADYNTTMQRSDAQRAEGIKNMEKMHDDRQVAEEERSGADVYDYTARDMNDYNARSGWLSMGGPQSDRRQPVPKEKEDEQKPVETKTPDTPKVDGDERLLRANPQNVVNMYLGANQADENPEETANLNEDDQALFEYMQEKYPNVKPLPSSQSARKNYYSQRKAWATRQDGSLNMDPWEDAWKSTDDEYGSAADKQALIEELRNWRGGGDSSWNGTQGQAARQVTEAGNDVSSKDSGKSFEQERR